MNSNRSLRFFCSLALASVLVLGSTFGQSPAAVGKRVTYYYQTQYYQGNYVSLSPIWKQVNPKTHKPITTDVMVAAFHLGYNTDGSPYIHLNDNVPSDPMFKVMWQQVGTLQKHGVTVRMMLGGAAQGSYADLFSKWHVFYPILKRTLQRYHLDGIDMDIEEQVSLADAKKIIDQLNKDFGSEFILTMAPVASALWGGANLSGFSYLDLYKSPEGKRINWFNGQFYSGFATLMTPADYEHAAQYFPPETIVAGMIGNPLDGNGYVDITTVAQTVKKLVAKYPKFGGVDSWEYFNTLPGGLTDPVKWAAIMTKAMGN
jgi:Glycosyl hydrolases family 18